ncbi:MAG TPA: hypothetical protein DF613_01070 [Lachnospiraceae bacterium]|nr:hypothetical protein [Lachnospiraceae bacterium]
MNIIKSRKLWVFITIFAMITAESLKTFAAEQDVSPTEAVEQESLSVDLPTLQEDEESPFDFMIDPQNLIYETDASIYGGGVVEKGANLLFHNRAEGKYDYSGSSDKLTVTNRSNVPVRITISAGIRDADDMQFVQDKDFPEDASCCVYLALVDDAGNEQPMSADGEVSICAELPGIPEDAGADTERTYSFGLIGDCSTDAGWSDISVHPEVTVTWKVEPVLTVLTDQDEKEEEPPLDEQQEDDTGEAPDGIDDADTDIVDRETADEMEPSKDVVDKEDETESVIDESAVEESAADVAVTDEDESDTANENDQKEDGTGKSGTKKDAADQGGAADQEGVEGDTADQDFG